MKKWLFVLMLFTSLLGASLAYADSSQHSGNVGVITAIDISLLKIQIDSKDYTLDERVKVYNVDALASRLLLKAGQKIEFWKTDRPKQNSQQLEPTVTQIRLVNPVTEISS